jgi:PBSX family phage portal protein
MTVPAAIHEAERSLQTILKAVVVGSRVQDPASRPGGEEASTAFAEAGALQPPYDPEALCLLVEHSNSLRPNVDAYATNIDGFGYRFDPVIDFDAEDARQRVTDALALERMIARDAGSLPDSTSLTPTAEEVTARFTELQRLARMERARLDGFFEFCCFDHSFVHLRRSSRQDLEVTGNAYWEVLRDGKGDVARFVYVPAYTVRLLPLDREATEIQERVRVSPTSFETVSSRRRLRRYVQIQGSERMYFKAVGDPRVISRSTGRAFPDVAALHAAQPDDGPATELMHFAIHSPRSPYGVPRWVGTLLSVLGSRSMEEINYLYFENKSVPPLALLVSGGRLSDSSVPRIERFIEENLKGKANFHKILILEADGTGTGDGGRAKIELRPLTEAQQHDALFQSYDERNIDKVGSSFRLPRLLRGESKDFNRACYSADTETLTENGWKLHRAITSNERIAVYDPVRDEMRWEVPTQKHVYYVKENLVRFHGRHTDILVTQNHRMLTRSPGRKRWAVEPAETTARRGFLNFMCASPPDESGKELETFVLPRVCKIPRGHTHAPISGDLWLEFLGYYLSDGGLLETDHKTAPYLVFLRQKKFAARMEECLLRIGWKYSVQRKTDGTQVFCISNRCLRSWLASHCGGRSNGRRIPWDYVTGLPVRQLHVLFDAMMDGDGTRTWLHRGCRPVGAFHATYHTASPVLADQAQVICLRLGLRAHKSWSEGAGVYRISHVERRTTQMKGVRDASIQEYEGEVYCFSCPGAGFFFTRRNGKVAIQGNTAESALRFAEDQVFQPERDEFDFLMNRKVLSDMGIRFWRFRSQTPVTRDPERMTEMVERLVRVGVLTPEEGRMLAGDIFNREFRKIGDDWVRRPITLTLAGIQTGVEDLKPKVPSEDVLLSSAKQLLSLREDLRAEEDRLATNRLQLARDYLDVERVKVPPEEFAAWFGEARDAT